MTTTPALTPVTRTTVSRPNPVSVGTIVWLASELMFFAGLFAMYFTLRSTVPQEWAVESARLNVTFTAVNTLILLLSSVTCQLGVFAAERFQAVRTGPLLRVSGWGLQEWIVVTFILGAGFIGGQVYEYATLITEGLTISSSAYGSAFYLLTGFHGLHVLGGLIAFLMVIGRTYAAKRFGEHEATTAVVTSYYWHFVDVVWVGVFVAIYLIK